MLGIELLPADWERYLEFEWNLTREIGLVQVTPFASYKQFVDTNPEGDTLANVQSMAHRKLGNQELAKQDMRSWAPVLAWTLAGILC